MFTASGLVRALGPAQAPMTVETVAGCTEAISVALRHTLAGKVTGPQLDRVRAVHRASMADYLRQHCELATSVGELTELLRKPTAQEQFDEVGRQLLLTLGFELTRHRTDRRPK
ncbi:hypothetical protein [Streptomyces lydicus]|uniref:hypothetical protein n=1 Tax=Streptomyces lydicus TaxID=47763 RepID=UPI0036E298D6